VRTEEYVTSQNKLKKNLTEKERMVVKLCSNRLDIDMVAHKGHQNLFVLFSWNFKISIFPCLGLIFIWPVQDCF